MTHTITPTTPAAFQQQMLDLIEELRTIPSHRRQQRCLAQLEVLRYQLHGHPDLLEQLASLLAVTGQALGADRRSVPPRRWILVAEIQATLRMVVLLSCGGGSRGERLS